MRKLTVVPHRHILCNKRNVASHGVVDLRKMKHLVHFVAPYNVRFKSIVDTTDRVALRLPGFGDFEGNRGSDMWRGL